MESGFSERGGSLRYFLHPLSLQTGLLDLNDHSVLNTDLLSVCYISMSSEPSSNEQINLTGHALHLFGDNKMTVKSCGSLGFNLRIWNHILFVFLQHPLLVKPN